MPKSVDIVILSWDRPEDTIDAVHSAASQKNIDANIIIVDQGSLADNIKRIRKACLKYKNAIILENEENVGVPGGRNQGSAKGASKYIVWIDNDAVFANEDCLDKALSILEDDDKLGVLSLGVENYFATTPSSQPDETSWVYGERPVHRNWTKTFREKSFVGAGAVIKRSVFEQAGGFDDFLFFLHEEEDLSKRLINLGYEIEYRGDLRVRHKVSPQHRVAWKGKRSFFNARNRIYLNYKYGVSIRQTISDVCVLMVAGARGGRLLDTLRGTGNGLLSVFKARSTRKKHNGMTHTTQAGVYYRALKLALWETGLNSPLDGHTGLQKFLRRLKWETGFMTSNQTSSSPKQDNRASRKVEILEEGR